MSNTLPSLPLPLNFIYHQSLANGIVDVVSQFVSQPAVSSFIDVKITGSPETLPASNVHCTVKFVQALNLTTTHGSILILIPFPKVIELVTT